MQTNVLYEHFSLLFISVTSYFQVINVFGESLFHGIKFFLYLDGSDVYSAPVLYPFVPPVFVLFILSP